MDAKINQRIESWLDGPYDEAVKAEIRKLERDNPKALEEAFFKELAFGTGGMRGKMGIGTNRMNRYTIRFASQGFANYLKKEGKGPLSVLIGYDVRKNSPEFAWEAARVFAGNGIDVLLLDRFCPTPLVSFGCRHFKCSGAVMITASHNPPEYNGYKVYWSDGAQVVSPHDEGIIQEVREIRGPDQVKLAEENSKRIRRIGSELDLAYLSILREKKLAEKGASLQIVYTNLHGTGIRIVPEALESWGFSSLSFVEEQKEPNGNFPNAPSPNPEEKKALALGMAQLKKEDADLLIATDPDADRMGVVALHNKEPFFFTGNQIACLCLYHICRSLDVKNALFIKTIVTTELFRAIAESFGGTCMDVLTGFKYIAEQIDRAQGKTFLFGAEESYGYLYDRFVRDKDAISSACLIAEAASLAKKEGKTLVDRMYELYQKFGIYRESLVNIAFPDSPEGMAKMQAIMTRLRKEPPKRIGVNHVERLDDFLKPQAPLPKSDVLRFWLSDGSKLVIRPSGTEPKVKIYIEVVQRKPGDLLAEISRLDARIKDLEKSFSLLLLPKG